MPDKSLVSEQPQLQHWQALLDSAGEGIWGLDIHGNCTFVNRMAVSTFGYTSEELLGNNMHDLVHHHYPDGREFPGSECPVYNVLLKRRSLRQLTDTMFRKDGSSFVAEISAQPVAVGGEIVGVVVTFRDVTEHRRQQEDLQRAYRLAEQRTAELDAVIESMPHGVYIATNGGDVRMNGQARQMSGWSFPKELKTLDRALKGESSSETVKAADCWIQSVAAPILLNGRTVGGVAVNTDVTQIRLQDEALRRSEKLAAVGQLASTIAHEINNPLESITNLLYLIRQSKSVGQIHEYADIAQGELSRVSEITLQTLRFHRQQSRAVRVDVTDIVRSVIALYTGRLVVRKIEVEWNCRGCPPVHCMEGEIRQVVNNLVRNALDAMSSGGRILLRIAPKHHHGLQSDGVKIVVADTGDGIDPAIQQKLFQPFQTTKELTGTGLGLWVSKGIVEKHGGRIDARSRKGHRSGTVFCVWLPLSGSSNLKQVEQ